MSHPKPTIALPVSDLAQSIAFYTQVMGFTLADHQAPADVAILIDSDGDPLLFAGPQAGPLTEMLADQHTILTPQDTLGFHGGDLQARQATLQQHDATVRIRENRLGDRTLAIQDPDGYTLVFRTHPQHTPQEMLALYQAGPTELETVLTPLTEEELDLALPDGGWTIRQLVHHIADAESIFYLPLHFAAAEPGRAFHFNFPSSNLNYSDGLHYTQRPIGSALAFIRATRQRVAELLGLLPDEGWARAVVAPGGRSQTVAQTVGIEIRHIYEHLEEINAILGAHGRQAAG